LRLKFISVIIIILISLSAVYAQDISKIHITCEFQNKPLTDLLLEIENEHKIIFFFKEEWISDIKVTRTFQNTPLIKVLEEILFDNEISFISFNPYSVFLIN